MSVFLAWLRQLAGLLSASTRYTAAGVTAGAVGIVVALIADVSWQLGFLVGFLAPWGPLYFYHTRRGALKAYLEEIEKLKEAKLITKADYDRFKEQALRWHAERMFGKDAGPEAPTAPSSPVPS